MEKRKSITNQQSTPMAVFTEPEGQEFWLLPGETFVLCAEVFSPEADFEIEHHELGLTVWPSNSMGVISVLAHGKELICGHQRPAGST